MKLVFEQPEIQVIGHVGPMTNDEIAALPDEALAEYLRENGFYKAVRARLEGEPTDETVD